MNESLFHRPAAELSDLVEYMWHHEYVMDHDFAERIFPQGNHYLLINLNHSPIYASDLAKPSDPMEIHHAMIDGAHTRAVVLSYGTTHHSMGMVFHPAAIPRLFGFPASDIVNEVIPLDAVLGGIVDEIRSDLLEAKSVGERFRLLEGLLFRYVDHREECNKAVSVALRRLDHPMSDLANISSLSQELGITHSRLIQLFRKEVGLTPKKYARLARFRAALRMLDAEQVTSLTTLAQDLRYFDQAHFIHDFRSLAGLTPRQYQRHFRNQASWARSIK